MIKNISCFIFILALALSVILLTPRDASACSNSGITHISNNKLLNDSKSSSKEEYVEVFNSNTQTLYITQSDINLLADLVYAESRGEPFEGKVAVASVVINRVLDRNFPSSIKGVIFQSNAFSCVKNNSIKANPDSSCYNAVYEAIRGSDPTGNALFFYNPSTATSSWMLNTEKRNVKSIGNHIFFEH